MPFPFVEEITYLTTAQMIEVDRLMVEEYGIELVQMMENAGRELAVLSRTRFLQASPLDKDVLVMAGPGGNGGGAMVAARRLAAWGANVSLMISHPLERMSGVPARQLEILQQMGIVPTGLPSVRTKEFDLIIDGLLGYGLSGAPRAPSAELIRFANANPAPVLALDVPSGMDANSGKVFSDCIKAAATLTLALPKTGFLAAAARAKTGELYCADISVPPQLYAQKSLGLKIENIFSQSEIIRLS